jgi:2'-5' RNA ligase
MRLFIGIALNPETVAALQGVRQSFAASGSELRWSAPEGWHVTLQFLGSCDEQQRECVQARLAEVRGARVPVRIAGLDFFDRAGVFFAGVQLSAELLALQRKATAAMRRCGFEAEKRPYHPHITLARTKGGAGAHALVPLKKAVERSQPQLDANFTAEEFLLYESMPGREGSKYEVRARFPLQG